jgi:hypothetical protein
LNKQSIRCSCPHSTGCGRIILDRAAVAAAAAVGPFSLDSPMAAVAAAAFISRAAAAAFILTCHCRKMHTPQNCLSFMAKPLW